jgi:hypothetical protein
MIRPASIQTGAEAAEEGLILPRFELHQGVTALAAAGSRQNQGEQH